MKKPVKKDNNIVDKKQEKMNAYLNELEESFFKSVSDGNSDQMHIIKQRGDNLNDDSHISPHKPQ